jgi:hypothetical protein
VSAEVPRLEPAPLDGALPPLRWRWDAETDILTGTCRKGPSDGFDGSVELTDPSGPVVVLDLADGAVVGVDVVVWPEVETTAQLALPDASRAARLVLATPRPLRGASAFEVEAPLALRANVAESLYHLRVGEAPVAQVVRVAGGLLVELDDQRRIAGCWLVDVPPFPSLDPDA